MEAREPEQGEVLEVLDSAVVETAVIPAARELREEVVGAVEPPQFGNVATKGSWQQATVTPWQ
jgi:hypothetical protein